MSQDDNLSLDDILDDIGGAAPVNPALAAMTPEERFYYDVTSGKYNKIYNCRYWLNQELSVCHHLIHDNAWMIGKSNKVARVQVSVIELGRSLIKYWLQMTYLPRFSTNVDGKPPCDIDIVLDMMLANAEISRTIQQYAS